MARRILPPLELLRERLSYNKRTGILRWRPRPLELFPEEKYWKVWNTRYAGKPTGTYLQGYLKTNMGTGIYLSHRLIWKMVTGEDPPNEIDHRNGQRDDNRWSNLRAATTQENRRNQRKQSRAVATGYKGVRRSDGGKGRFQAVICIGRRDDGGAKYVCLGSFGTPEAAHAAYCKAARRYFGEFWSPG